MQAALRRNESGHADGAVAHRHTDTQTHRHTDTQTRQRPTLLLAGHSTRGALHAAHTGTQTRQGCKVPCAGTFTQTGQWRTLLSAVTDTQTRQWLRELFRLLSVAALCRRAKPCSSTAAAAPSLLTCRSCAPAYRGTAKVWQTTPKHRTQSS